LRDRCSTAVLEDQTNQATGEKLSLTQPAHKKLPSKFTGYNQRKDFGNCIGHDFLLGLVLSPSVTDQLLGLFQLIEQRLNRLDIHPLGPVD
jgi:hypothetical protein